MSFFSHLLESTLFAAAVWWATLALRRNHARQRHALWMVASLKFLVPFSLLVSFGGSLAQHPPAPAVPAQMRFVMADATPPVPLSGVPKTATSSAQRRDWRPSLVWVLWSCGCAAFLFRWCLRSRRASHHLRHAVPFVSPGDFPAPILASPSLLEPAVFGIFRPVLLFPAALRDRLSPAQFRAILAHELCHIRRHDNLAAALHMFVEAVFWFHPLVWWIGGRLVDERERACDEEVLERGSDRAVYARTILQVCRICLELPLPCVSGITGADLQLRVLHIMTAPARHRLEPAKKFLLALLAIAAIGTPMAIGLAHPQRLPAQPQPQTAKPLSFDVASVKASPRTFLVIFPERHGGRITWTTDLTYLLSYAYHLQGWRISGPIPGSDHIYTVDAITDPGATDDQVRLMFQTLIADRFRMTAHRVTKDVEGYALTVALTGIKIPEVVAGSPRSPMPEWFRKLGDDPSVLEGRLAATVQAAGVGAITGRAVTMLQLSEALQRVLRQPVLDHTGLAGKYDIGFEFAQENAAVDVDFPPLTTVLRQLGLRLEKHRSPVEMLVVDHIETTPTEN